jgi:hypothetical protein
MDVLTDRRRARALPWVRLAALVPVSMLVGHELVFALQYGVGNGLQAAMAAGGHDNYWTAFTVVISALSAGLLAREVARAARLRSRLRELRGHGQLAPAAAPAAGSADSSVAAWRAEFRRIWPPLFALTAVGFTVQENLEHMAAGQAPHGLGSLIAGEHPLALPILALVSAAIAGLGALVRWRIRSLEARVAEAIRAASTRHRHPRSLAPAPEWPPIGALRAHAWFLVRLLAGRAPPAIA